MQKYHDTVQDVEGNGLTTASIYVTVASSGAPAAIFKDDESTAINNPITSADTDSYDDLGNFGFKAANGVYNIQIVVSGQDDVWRTERVLYDFNDATTSPTKLIHPNQSKGLQELQAQGVYPSSFNQQWGGMGYGGLPDDTLGEIATCNVSSDGTSTTINATNVDCAFKVSKTMDIKGVFIKIYKTANLTGNTVVTINSVTYNVPEKTITDNTDGEWVWCPIVTTLTADTTYNANVATTGNSIQWMDGNGNYPHGGDNQFIIVASDADSILNSGLSGFDGALHCYEGAPLDQSGAFYFKNTDLNHKRGTALFSGTGFGKDKTFFDSGLGTDSNRIVMRCNVTTGYAQVDLYENDGTKHTVTGTTDISTGNHTVALRYRSEGDGADVLYLYVDGLSEGTPLTSQTITLDRAFEDGHSTIGGGFPLAPAWTDDQDMSVLPSADGWTFTTTGTEANQMAVNDGILYQNGAGYGSTESGYYNKTTTLNNATGWSVETKVRVSESTNTPQQASAYISVFDGAERVDLQLHEHFLTVRHNTVYNYVQIDLKTKPVTLNIYVKGNDLYLFADGKLIYDAIGLHVWATATNTIRFGDFTATADENASAEWYYLKYYEGAHLPEYSTMQLSEFAYWADDKSSLLSTIYNAGSIQSVKTLAGMNENYVNKVKQVIGVRGITVSPTNTTTLAPLDEMSTFSFGSSLKADFRGVFQNSGGGGVSYAGINIDGAHIDNADIGAHESGNANDRGTVAVERNEQVYSGLKHVNVVFNASAGTTTARTTRRKLTVEAE